MIIVPSSCRRPAVKKTFAPALWCLLGLWPATANAHLVSTGLGPFYDGVSHLILAPEDLLATLGIALFSGLAGRNIARLSILILPATWFIGGVAGARFAAGGDWSIFNALSLVVVGLLIAADGKLPAPIAALLAAAVGLLHGYLNGEELGSANGGIQELLGIVTSALVVLTLGSAGATISGAGKGRVIFRIVGSWLAALGLLLVGWAIRGQFDIHAS
jgi:urease accessory protein